MTSSAAADARLAAWSERSDEDREAMLARPRDASAARCDEAKRAAYGTLARGSTTYVVAALATDVGLVVTTCSHFRISHWAQSGSDWCEQHVRIDETTWAAGPTLVAERVIEQRTLSLTEREEDDWDDARAAAGVVEGALRQGLVRVP